MANYSLGFRSRMVQRMAGPEGISATALAKEVGVSQGTLSRWLRKRATLGDMTKKKVSMGARRSAEDKLRVVLQAANLSQEELGGFLRREGVHESQLEEWREAAFSAATNALKDSKRKKSEQTPEARELRELQRELRRKDKALAEAAALLVLQKKLQAYFSEDTASGTSTRSET